MKRLLFILLCALLVCGACPAQRRFRVGVHGGVNTTSYTFSRVTIGGTEFRPGSARAGYGAGFVLQLNLTRHLYLQSELDYTFVNYSFRARGATVRDITLRTTRLDIPVLLGLRFGPVRFFGGPQFRAADSESSNIPKLLSVNFNRNTGIIGGLGIDIGRFFIDFRISGYPRPYVWNTFISNSTSQRVKVPRNIVYGGSLGFLF